MSRLVDRGPHAVTVYPRVSVDTEMGPVAAYGEPVSVQSVRVSPRAASVVTPADGQRYVTTEFRIVGGGYWPGNDGAKIIVDEGPAPYVGKELYQRGEVLARASNPRVAHYVVTCFGKEG